MELMIPLGILSGLLVTIYATPLIVEGDIVWDKKLEKIRRPPKENEIHGKDELKISGRVKRNLLDRSVPHEHRWRHGMIPYLISTKLGQPARMAIKAAFDQIEKYTCVRFTPRQEQRDYVEFILDHGCYSSIGRQNGRQLISIGPGCEHINSVVHEILHTLGMFHEQTRYDRDLYVHVLWWNVQTEAINNFDIYHHGIIDSLKFPYDFFSATHYENKDFSKNGGDTIQAIGNPKKRLGSDNGMSKIDMKKILATYRCGVKNAPKKDVCRNKYHNCHRYISYCSKRWFSERYCQKECGVCV